MQNQASQPAPNRALDFSQKLYQRLLRAYPRGHREEFGGAMAQLFRDQCRDAWAEQRTPGLVALWLRTVPDLVKTSFIERWSNFKPGKFMADTLNALRPRKFPASVFFTVFITVFVITVIISTVTTFLLPESYASTARLKIAPDPGMAGSVMSDPYFPQTTFQLILSPVVLSNVVSTLDLNKEWGRRYYAGEMLKTSDTVDLLKRRLELKTVRNTSLIEITAYNDDRMEAAALANAVGRSFQEYRLAVYTDSIAKNLPQLTNQYEGQISQIGRLRVEMDALAGKYHVAEVPPADLQNFQNQFLADQRVYVAMKTQLQGLQTLKPEQLPDVLPTVTGDALLSDLLGKLHDAQRSLAGLQNDYASNSPPILRATSTIDEINREIAARVTGILLALQSETSSKRASLDALQASITSATQNSKPTPENQPYWNKKEELERLLSSHNALASQIEADKLNLLLPPSLVEFTDYAEPGDVPVRPNKTLDICAGVIYGVFLGAVAGYLFTLVGRRWGKRKPVLGMI